MVRLHCWSRENGVASRLVCRPFGLADAWEGTVDVRGRLTVRDGEYIPTRSGEMSS